MENSFCKKICRFCFETSDSNFETIEEVIFANLEFLWLKINLSISEQPVMCGDCAKTVKTISDFKTKCLEIENCISSVKDKDSDEIDLRKIYVNKTPVENIVNVSGDYVVCRLCLELVKNDSVILLKDHTDIGQKLEQNFPELDITCTDDPVICASCQVSLQCYFNFINTCSTAEKKIMEYCKVEGTNSMGQIDLNSVVNFISKDFLTCKLEIGEVKIEEICNEVSENTSYRVEMKKEEILDMELDIKKDSSAQESELNDEIRFQLHSSPSYSRYVPQLTGVKPAKYTCQICGKCKHDLQVHMITYKDGTEVTTNKCDLCDLGTKRKPKLKEHILTHKTHLDTTMYECDLCEYQTKWKSSLKRHMLTHKTHSEISTYKCDLCDYEAKRKFDQKRHMLTHKTHSEITMYKCDLCPYEAKVKYILKRHMLTHKTHSEVTMYKCDLCDYGAKLKANLKGHMLTHKSHLETIIYKCDLCDYVAKWEKNIKRHMLTHKTHRETTMYKCDLCDYQTKWKFGLKRHMSTHKTRSETIMYKCDLCNYEAKEKYNLETHMLTHKAHLEITIYKRETCAYENRLKDNLNTG